MSVSDIQVKNGNSFTSVFPITTTQGGTGITSSPSMLTNLGSTSAANVFQTSPRPGVTGTLAINNGGTGATTAANARTNLQLTPKYYATSGNNATLTVKPPYDGYIDVEINVDYLWGYAGGSLTIEVNTPSGLTKVYGSKAIVTKGDTIGRPMHVRAVFSGAKANTSYTFQASISGSGDERLRHISLHSYMLINYLNSR